MGRSRCLGIHLTLGFVLSLLVLGTFVKIVDSVGARADLASYDRSALEAVRQHRTAGGVTLFKGLSILGSEPWLAAFAAAVAAFLLWRRDRLLLVGWVVALTGTGLLDTCLKLYFHRHRPLWQHPLIESPGGWSFPSGHATGSTVAYGMLAYLLLTLWVRRTPARVGVAATAVLLILMIGFSRVYLGVHFPTDVAAGFAVGAVWLSACVTGFERCRRASSEPLR